MGRNGPAPVPGLPQPRLSWADRRRRPRISQMLNDAVARRITVERAFQEGLKVGRAQGGRSLSFLWHEKSRTVPLLFIGARKFPPRALKVREPGVRQ
jgi:hypothetical protein